MSNKLMEGEVLSKMTKRLTFILLVLALALAISGAPAWAADAAAGKAVYTSKCQTCHAADGSGNPGLGKALGVTWVPLGSADVQKLSDDDLKKVITGGKGTLAGPVVGGMVFGAVPEVLRAMEIRPEAQWIIYGVLMILIVYFLPRGIVPAVQAYFSGAKHEPANTAASAAPKVLQK